MIELSKKYRTSHGKEVRLYAVDGVDPYPIHGAFKSYAGWEPTAWTIAGKNRLQHDQSNADLIEVKPSAVEEMIAWLEASARSGVPVSIYVEIEEALTEARRIRDSNATSDE